MIIQPTANHRLFIAQRDHARMAADILAYWTLDGFGTHPRREVILAAAREHDNGWIEEDADTHVGADGEPQDFISVPPPVKHRIWPRATVRLAERDPYVAALVAQHALTVNEPNRSDPAWQGFFDRMEQARSDLLARCAPGAHTAIDQDYPFVRIADLLSLIVCNGWRTPFTLPGGASAILRDALEVSPDPFGGRRVTFEVPSRTLPLRRYASPLELRADLANAAVVMLRGEATAGN
jgi:hypothetical protein